MFLLLLLFVARTINHAPRPSTGLTVSTLCQEDKHLISTAPVHDTLRIRLIRDDQARSLHVLCTVWGKGIRCGIWMFSEERTLWIIVTDLEKMGQNYYMYSPKQVYMMSLWSQTSVEFDVRCHPGAMFDAHHWPKYSQQIKEMLNLNIEQQKDPHEVEYLGQNMSRENKWFTLSFTLFTDLIGFRFI